MPIRRFHSLKEAEESVWFDADDPRLWPTIRTVWELAARLSPRRFPSGVYRHRTIADLNRQTREWDSTDDGLETR